MRPSSRVCSPAFVFTLLLGAAASAETAEPPGMTSDGSVETAEGPTDQGSAAGNSSTTEEEGADDGERAHEENGMLPGEDLADVSIDDFDVPDEASFEPLWDADWDPNLAFRSSGCVLDLASGAKSDAIGDGYYFFATLTIPLRGCRPLGAEQRAEKARAPVLRVAHGEGEEGGFVVAAREREEGAESSPVRQSERRRAMLLPVPRGFLAEFRRRVLEARGVKRAEERIDSLIRRERASGLLPELRLRGAHGFDQSLALATVGAVPGQSTTRDGSDLLMEARLTFRLHRLIVGDSEVALERARQTLFDKAEDVVKDALGQLLIFRRASVLARQDDRSDEERLDAELQAEGARIRLHILTGGWFPLEGPLPSANSGAN